MQRSPKHWNEAFAALPIVGIRRMYAEHPALLNRCLGTQHDSQCSANAPTHQAGTCKRCSHRAAPCPRRDRVSGRCKCSFRKQRSNQHELQRHQHGADLPSFRVGFKRRIHWKDSFADGSRAAGALVGEPEQVGQIVAGAGERLRAGGVAMAPQMPHARIAEQWVTASRCSGRSDPCFD